MESKRKQHNMEIPHDIHPATQLANYYGRRVPDTALPREYIASASRPARTVMR